MTNSEFSAQFDVLWNNIASNQSPGLNEFEKSVVLTKAEYQLVTEYFNSRVDAAGGGFDGSQKRQYDFSGLIRTENLFYVNSFKEDRISDTEKFDRRSYVYLFPMNYFLAVNEMLRDSTKQYSVMPLDYAEYQRLMMKPYPLPVKRGAWRLFTDKKNCNYWHKYLDSSATESSFVDESNTTDVDYEFLSSWADHKRTLSIHISFDATLDIGSSAGVDQSTDDDTDIVRVRDNTTTSLGFVSPKDAVIKCSKEWVDDVYTINIKYNCDSPAKQDDEEVSDILRAAFAYALDVYHTPEGGLDSEDTLYKVMTHVDGFRNLKAPGNHFEMYRNGLTIKTDVVEIPMAEIIGKFDAVPTYQLRFVRKLMPIILEDLTNYGDDLSINGITKATECMLPEECHQEILERAVTLAKIAWQGGTATQAAAAQNNRRE